jgi:hypothetical protein
MKNRQHRQRPVVRTAAVMGLCASSMGLADPPGTISEVKEWDEFKVFIEICGTDEDAGLKLVLGGEPWKSARILAPNGELIYKLGPRLLGDVGSDTVFLESAEPPFEELPLDEFLDRFPEGEYEARGVTLEGDRLMGTALLTHDLPAGPLITSHEDDEVVELTGENLLVTWDPVTGDYRGGVLGSAIVGYILTVTFDDEIFGETVERELTIDVIPPDTFSAEIPADFLKPDTEVQIEVAAREESGNRTSKEIFIDVVDAWPNN